MNNKPTLWELLTNPPTKKIHGINIPAWRVPDPEERKEMVEAIEEWIRRK